MLLVGFQINYCAEWFLVDPAICESCLLWINSSGKVKNEN